MVGVGEEDFHAEIFGEIALGESFDGSLRADGHEDGGFDCAVGGVEESGAGAGLGALGDDFECGAQEKIVARGARGMVSGNIVTDAA
jgi:hypothetical protein